MEDNGLEPNVVDNEENNSSNISSAPTPPKKPNARVAASNMVKTTANITRKVLEIFAAMPLPLKIAIIVIIAIVILVVVVLEAEAAESTDAFTDSVDNVVNSETYENLSDEAKASYEKYGSFIKFPIEALLLIYDDFANSGDFGGAEIRENYNYVLGTNEVEIKEGTGTPGGSANIDYDVNFTRGQDGVRDDNRVQYITGSTAPVSTYKTGGSYVWSDGKVGSATVEITDVEIRCWTSNGETTYTIKVNSKLANLVKTMFEEIYNNPSKPIIDSIHGLRTTDGYPGHPFGVAIDINPVQNPMPGVEGNIADYKPGVDSRSMDENHPIVKIIRDKYGWAWGGDFSSTKDYMHFSFWGG